MSLMMFRNWEGFFCVEYLLCPIGMLLLCFSVVCAGEGIHTAMVAGKIAAQSVSDMFKSHNFSLQAMKAYGESPCSSCFLYINI